jgi:thiazole synthase
MNKLKIADKEFTSRLIVGTSRYPDPKTMLEALDASGTEMVTVSIRRLNMYSGNGTESIMGMLNSKKFSILPNTAGC